MVDEPKTYTFTEEEVLGFTNTIKELELKDSLNVSLVMDLESQIKLYEENSVIDSMLIANKTTQINLLKDTNKLLEQKVKLVQPKWYENKWLYFTYGVLMTATSVKIGRSNSRLMAEQIKEVIKQEYIKCATRPCIFYEKVLYDTTPDQRQNTF